VAGSMAFLPASSGGFEDRHVVAYVRGEANPKPSTSAELTSGMMSPFIPVLTMTADCSGRYISW
jgi:hypothetical protein